MRAHTLNAARALVLAGPAVLAFSSGGYFARTRVCAGLVAWALVVLVAVLAPRPLPRSPAGRVALAGLLALTAWTALSLLWAPLGGPATADLERLVLYLGALVAATALLRGASLRRWVEPVLAGGSSWSSPTRSPSGWRPGRSRFRAPTPPGAGSSSR